MNETLSVTLQAFDNMSHNLSNISKYVNQLAQDFETVEQQAKSAESAVNSANTSLSKTAGDATSASSGLEKTSQSASEASSNLEKTKQSSDGIQTSLTKTAEAASQAGTQVMSASQQISELGSQLRTSSKHASVFDSGIMKIVKRVGSIMLVGKAFSMIGEGMSKALSRLDTFQVFRRNVTNFVGDAQKAEDAINSLNEFTTGTAYALDTSSTMVQRFVTSGGKSIEDAVTMSQNWMDIISTYGKGTSRELEEAGNALTKMLSKGKVNMLQLNTLTQTIGIPVVRAYAAAVGRSAEEVQDDLSKGVIRAEEFESTVRQALLQGVDGFAAASGMAKIAGTTWEAVMANSSIAVARGVQSVIESIDKGFKSVTDIDFKTTYLNIFKTFELILKDFGKVVETYIPKIVEFLRPVIDMLNSEEGRQKLASDIEKVVKSLLMFETLKTTTRIIGSVTDKLHNLSIYAHMTKVSMQDALGMGSQLTPSESMAEAARTKSQKNGKGSGNKITDSIVGFSNLTGSITKLFKGAFTHIKKDASEGFKDMQSSGETAARGLSNVFTPVWNTISRGFTFVFKKMGNYSAEGSTETVNAWSRSAQHLNGIWTSISSGFGAAMKKFKSYSAAGSNEAVDAWSGSGSRLNEVLRGLLGAPLAAIKLIKESVGPVIEKIFNSKLVQSIVKFTQGITKVIQSAGLLVGTLMGVVAVLGALTIGFGIFNADGALGNKVNEFFNGVIERVTDFGNKITSTLSGLGTKLSQPVVDAQGNVDEGFANYGALYAQRGVELIGNFVMGIINSAGKIGAVVINIIIAAADALIKSLPIFVDAGFKLIQSFISGIMNNGPLLLKNFLGWVATILTYLNQKLPEWTAAGVQMITNFFNGIIETGRLLFTNLPTFLSNIGGVIMEYAPTLIEQGANLILNLIKGIGSMVGALINGAVDLLFSFISAFTADPMGTIQAGIDIMNNIISGIVSLGQKLWDAAIKIGQDLIQWIWDGICSFWNNLVENWNNLWNQWFGDGGQANTELSVSGNADQANNAIRETSDTLRQQQDQINQDPLQIPAEVVGTEQLAQDTKNATDQISQTAGVDVNTQLGDTTNMQTELTQTLDGIEQNAQVNVQTNMDPSAVIQNADSAIQQMGEAVQGKYDEIVSHTQNTLSMVKDNTINTFAQTFEEVQNQLNNIFDTYELAMAGRVNATVDQVNQTIDTTFGQLREGYVQALNEIILSVEGCFTELNVRALEKLNELSSLVTLMLGSIVTEYQTKFAEIRDNTTDSIDDLVLRVIGSMHSLNTVLETSVSDLGSNMVVKFNESTNRIQLNYAIFAAFIKSETETMGQEMVSSVEKGLGDAVGYYDSYIKDVKGRLNDLSAFHRSIGEQMMGDLNAGLEAKKQEVLDTTNELVEQIKQVFIKGLGIHSPSRWGYYIGLMTGQGVINGLTGSQMEQFVAYIIDNMKSSFEEGDFKPKELVQYLKEDTLKVIDYLNLKGDKTESKAAPQDDGMIAFPLLGTRGDQSSWFGLRDSPGGIGSRNHQGVDLATPTGTPILSALPGVVTTAGWYGGYGNAVVVDSGNGLTIVYGHMSSVGTSVGAQVGKGQQIGLVGSTGNSTGPHLHFEMRQNGQPFDPQPYIDGAASVAGLGTPNTLAGAIQQAYNEWKGIPTFGMSGNLGNINYDVSAGAEQWRSLVIQALQMLGQPISLADAVMATLDKESSGNPNAINDWDSNWQRGTPSKGLMQVIDPTFRSYAIPGYDTNIWDPLSNILASLNYQLKVYGGIWAHLNGYAAGTKSATQGLHWVGEKGPELMYFAGGETVIPHKNSEQLFRSLYGFKVGTRLVPYDMPAIIHEGEAILPKSQNPYSQSGGDYLADIGSMILQGAEVGSAENIESLFDSIDMMFNPVMGSQEQREQSLGMLSSSPQVNFGSLADLSEIEQQPFDVQVPTPSSTPSSSHVDNSVKNVTFDVTNNNNVDGEKFIDSLESELHKIFEDGRQRRGGRA